MSVDERPETVRRTDVAVPTPHEILADERAAVVRADVALKVTLVTLLWLVSVSLSIGWEISGTGDDGGGGYLLAAVILVLLPFVAAVIATRNRQFFLGGAYVVLTLAMVVPAVSIAGAPG